MAHSIVSSLCVHVIAGGALDLARLLAFAGVTIRVTADGEEDPWRLRSTSRGKVIEIGRAEARCAGTPEYVREAAQLALQAVVVERVGIALPSVVAESLALVVTLRLLGFDDAEVMRSGRVELSGEVPFDVVDGALPERWRVVDAAAE